MDVELTDVRPVIEYLESIGVSVFFFNLQG